MIHFIGVGGAMLNRDCLSENLSSTRFEKTKLKKLVKLHVLQRKFLIKPLLRKESLKSIKPTHHLICLLMGSLKIFVSFLQPKWFVCHMRLFKML